MNRIMHSTIFATVIAAVGYGVYKLWRQPEPIAATTPAIYDLSAVNTYVAIHIPNCIVALDDIRSMYRDIPNSREYIKKLIKNESVRQDYIVALATNSRSDFDDVIYSVKCQTTLEDILLQLCDTCWHVDTKRQCVETVYALIESPSKLIRLEYERVVNQSSKLHDDVLIHGKYSE